MRRVIAVLALLAALPLGATGEETKVILLPVPGEVVDD